MQVAKWGNSLAVRLPATVVEALGLKPGDNIDIHVRGDRSFAIEKAPGARDLLARIRKYRVDCRPTSSSTVQWQMSGGEDFFDTNVVLYLLSADTARPIGQRNCSPSGGRSASRF